MTQTPDTSAVAVERLAHDCDKIADALKRSPIVKSILKEAGKSLRDLVVAQDEQVGALERRLSRLDSLCATAERGGPSKPGYVTDSTFYNWCGQRSALQEVTRALKEDTQ